MISLLINAGGKSERMKKDFPGIISKCWLELEGTPIIMRNILELHSLVDEIIIILKDESMKNLFIDKFQTLKEFNSVKNLMRFIIDDSLEFPNDHGPMLSIKTGIKNAKNNIIISIPSDIPFLDKKTVELMLKKLVNNTILSIRTDSYFNTLLFVANKNELLFLSKFTWKRVTDIYRLVPNVLLLDLPNSVGNYFIGINTKENYDQAQKLAKEYRFGQTNSLEGGVRLIKRTVDLEESILNLDSKVEETLFQEKCYYLLIKLYRKHNKKHAYKINDLFNLEYELWYPLNKIIAHHCKIDFEKSFV